MFSGEEIKGRKGNNARNGRCRFERFHQRQAQAKERQAAYDALTPQQKLDRLGKRIAEGLVPGQAKKEKAKLVQAIAGAISKVAQDAAIQAVKKTGDEQLKKMQTPQAKKAAREAFNATPKELGEAAVKGAKRGTALGNHAYYPADQAVLPRLNQEELNAQEDTRRRARAERWAQKKSGKRAPK